VITRRSAKAKGSRAQNEVRDKLRETFSSLEPDDIQSVSSGSNGVDIKLSPAARKLIPYSIEVKNQEKISIWKSLTQAETNTKVGTDPVLIFKRNRSKTYAVVDLDVFIKLISTDDKRNERPNK